MSVSEKERRTKIVVENFDGIVPTFEPLYINSIRHTAEQSFGSFKGYEIALKNQRPERIIFGEIQEAISHAAALARYFWPSTNSPLHQARGKKLRAAFLVSDKSALSNIKLRNTLEHFDERIDEFLLFNDAGYFMPDPIVDDHSIVENNIAKIFKLIDPNSSVVIVLNQRFEFLPIQHEVMRILSLANLMADNGFRLTKK